MTKRMVAGFFIGAVAGWVYNQSLISVLLCAAAGVFFARKYAKRPPSRVFHKLFSFREALREESREDRSELKKEPGKTVNAEE